MTWVTPWLAIWTASVVVPLLLILYFLKLKRIEREISTTLLWRKAIEDFQANAPFQRLRRNILLLLQLLVLAMILIALAQPEIDASQPASHQHVLMIDRSASMRATDQNEQGTRLERAKQEAIQFVDNLRDPSSGLGGLFDSTIGTLTGTSQPHEIMVIAFDGGAQVRQSFTTDKNLVRDAIESIEQTDAPSSIDEALRLAGAYTLPELIEDQGLELSLSADLHLWSDGNLRDIEDASVPPNTTFVYHDIGHANTGNLAITSASVERAYDQPEFLQVFVSVQSTGDAPRQVDVELGLDGTVVGIRRVTLTRPQSAPPDEPWSGGVSFALRYPSGGLARINLLTDDALEADNEALLRIDPMRRNSVALVTGGNLFLQTAMEGMNLERLTVLSPAQLDRLVDDDELGSHDVLVLDGVRPPVRDGRVVSGRFLVFNALADVDGLRAREPIGDSSVVLEWDRDHEALQLANLDQLVIGSHLGFDAEAPSVELARSEFGPVIAESFQGAAQMLIVGFDPIATTWPFDPGFVLFMTSAIEYLGARASVGDDARLTPGQTLTYRASGAPTRVTLRTPEARTIDLVASEGGEVAFGPLRRRGVYTLRWRDAGEQREHRIPVNIFDAQESSVATRQTLELASRTVEAQDDSALTHRRELWPWFVLAAIALVLLEWYVYNRKTMI
ncbi:MAG: VWA domain-containing protein [Phycisphaerales bacterium JB043]